MQIVAEKTTTQPVKTYPGTAQMVDQLYCRLSSIDAALESRGIDEALKDFFNSAEDAMLKLIDRLEGRGN